MLQLLEGEEVITLLSDLHGVISSVYEVYASRRTGFLDFEGFMRFCTDFEVFPDVINKSDAYRIFMNLAFAHEQEIGGIEGSRMSTASVFGGKRGSV